jgi:hypothetical protein
MEIFTDIKKAITRFTRWLAGVDDDILESCPEGDRRKYSNLGVFVFFSFCVGYMVFSYLAGIAGQGSFSIWIVGLFAGLFLAAIDRLLMVNLKWAGSWKSTVVLSLPRVLITLFIGILVGEAVCLHVFEPEIKKQLALDKGKALAQITTSSSAAFGEIERLEDDNKSLLQQIEEKEHERSILYGAFIGEAEGTSGTKKFGKGPVYHEKKEQYDLVENEFQNISTTNNEKIGTNNKRINQLKEKRDESINDARQSLPENSGILLNINALDEFTSSSGELLFWRIMIILFFCAVDSAPVLMKLLSLSPQPNVYETKIEAQRQAAAIAEAKTCQADQEIQQESEKIRKQESLRVARKVYEHASEKEIDLAIRQLDAWHRAQLKSINVPATNFNTTAMKN